MKLATLQRFRPAVALLAFVGLLCLSAPSTASATATSPIVTGVPATATAAHKLKFSLKVTKKPTCANRYTVVKVTNTGAYAMDLTLTRKGGTTVEDHTDRPLLPAESVKLRSQTVPRSKTKTFTVHATETNLPANAKSKSFKAKLGSCVATPKKPWVKDGELRFPVVAGLRYYISIETPDYWQVSTVAKKGWTKKKGAKDTWVINKP